jgi:hypothetical protein
VTPILVRPVREQLEHDRVIRLLQQRLKRKYLVGINQGSETTASIVLGETTLYPDVVLAPLGKPNKPEIVVEVETGESVNNLEAMAEWVRLAQVKAAFHLYVPAGSVDPARRLCADHSIDVAEIWTYHPIGDQMRFNLVYKAPEPTRASRRAAAQAAAARAAARPAVKATARPAVKATAKPAVKVEVAKPAARKAAPKPSRKAAGPGRSAKPAPAKRAKPAKSAQKAARAQKRR